VVRCAAGYLTALLEPGEPVELERVLQLGWPAQLHVIGKDILRFHAVYWPAMLLSAGLPIPERVFGHGFLTREGQKMGKSLGNVLDPELLLERCGRDAVRWYLLRDIPFGDDGDFQQQRFSDLVNNDLANTIGNLLNRTSSMARKWFAEAVPPEQASGRDATPWPWLPTPRWCSQRRHGPARVSNGGRSDPAACGHAANGYLNERAPWSVMKQPGAGGRGWQLICMPCWSPAAWWRCCWRRCCRSSRPACWCQLGQVPALPRALVQQPQRSTWSPGTALGRCCPTFSPCQPPEPVMQRLELDGPL
jgi:methionyl-tRNA synthetase